ncbi:MAG: hypothetical protein QXS93_04135 [Candidatus Micrarchaeia archaeon]
MTLQNKLPLIAKALGTVAVSACILLHTQPLKEEAISVSKQDAQEITTPYGQADLLHTTAVQASQVFMRIWGERAGTSLIILEEARNVMQENKGRKYKLGEWDCALFTREVYSRAISRVMRTALNQVNPGAAYEVSADIGSTTYEQWNSTEIVISEMRKSLLAFALSESNIGDLIFHKDVAGEVANPTPKEKYGHVAIYTGKRNGVHYAIANTKRKEGSGVMELPLSKMFKAGRLDGMGEPKLFVTRPCFSSFDIFVDNGKVVLKAGDGVNPIKITIHTNEQ